MWALPCQGEAGLSRGLGGGCVVVGVDVSQLLFYDDLFLSKVSIFTRRLPCGRPGLPVRREIGSLLDHVALRRGITRVERVRS